MKVSLIQMNSINDKAANIAAAEALIERAVAEESPDWVLLPEQFDWAGGARQRNSPPPSACPAVRPMKWRGPSDQAPHLRPRRLDHGKDRRRGPLPQYVSRL